MARANRLVPFFACVALLAGGGNASADYPDHPVRFIVGVAAGGGTDTLARLTAQKLSEKWGQPVVVENKAGADHTIAAEYVAHGPHDGYTLHIMTNAHTVSPNLYKLSYDPVKDFAPIIEIGYVPDVIMVNPASPIKSLKELMDLARAKPGQLNYGDGGKGTAAYFEVGLMMKMAGVHMVHVGYQGGAQAMVGLLGGEVQFYSGAMPTIIEQVRSGKLRAIAVATSKRSPLLPDVPTIAEAMNLKDFEAADGDWTGLIAPAGTPKEIVNKINQDITSLIKNTDMGERMAAIGFTPVETTPEVFAEKIKNDIPRWGALLKSIDDGK